MPITKQAIKRMKQNEVTRVRKRHYGSRMKSFVKLILGYIQGGEMDKAKKIHPEVMKAIDTASKKNIIHSNNAARKKSRIQRALSNGKAAAPATEKKTAKKAPAKKTAPKVEKAPEAKEVQAEKVEKKADTQD